MQIDTIHQIRMHVAIKMGILPDLEYPTISQSKLYILQNSIQNIIFSTICSYRKSHIKVAPF